MWNIRLRTRLVQGLAVGVLSIAALCSPAQTTVSTRLAWDVTSIRQNTSGPREQGGDPQSTNIPMGPDDSYRNTGGIFIAKNTTLRELIAFAYKVTTAQREVFRASLPEWAMTDAFDVQARTDNEHVTKDEMRQMMQALLADRFKLSVHHENRDLAVYAAVLVKPNTLGPHMRLHPADEPCSNIAPPPGGVRVREIPSGKAGAPPPPPPGTVLGGYPLTCGGFANMPPEVPGHRREGARNMPIPTMVTAFTGLGNLGRPVVDRTGLTGNFDWVIEFRQNVPGAEIDPDVPGPVFVDALKNQLGLRLEAEKASIPFTLVDHVEHPSAN